MAGWIVGNIVDNAQMPCFSILSSILPDFKISEIVAGFTFDGVHECVLHFPTCHKTEPTLSSSSVTSTLCYRQIDITYGIHLYLPENCLQLRQEAIRPQTWNTSSRIVFTRAQGRHTKTRLCVCSLACV
jgi:hypothetical protein